MKFDIENYVKDNLDRTKETSTGELTAVCPWCDKFGAFYINKKTGNFICFKCENKGLNLVGVVAQVEEISFSEARKFIFKKSVQFRRKESTRSLLEWVKSLRGKEEEFDFFDEEKVDVELPQEFTPVFKNGVWKYPSYLKERGIKKSIAKKFNLGFCNNGRYAGRIVIPIECPNGKSFVARDATGNQKPKVLNPKHVDQSRLLLGWNLIKPDCDVVICEGPFDALKLFQNGFSPLALLGKVLHPLQRFLLTSRSNESAITIMLDPEEIEAPFSIATQLAHYFERVFIAELPKGIDPGEATKKQTKTAYKNAKKYDGNRFDLLSKKVQETQNVLKSKWV